MPPEDEFYDCTVPAQIAEKILRKLGWEDSSDSDEGDKWWLLVKHTINETEFFGGKTFDVMSAEINGLPTPSTEEIKRKLAERIYEI